MRRVALVPLAIFFLSTIHAEPPKPAAKAKAVAKDKWTPDDVVYAESAAGFQVAPKGRYAVWVKTVGDKEKGERISNLMRTDLKDGTEIELTRGNISCTAPRWSPDGKRIAFLTARPPPKSKGDDKSKDDDDAKTQVWLLDPFGGEPWPLTDHSRGADTFGWAGNDAILFVAKEEATYRENALKDDKKDASVVVEDEKHEPPSRLYRMDIKSKKATRLTDNKDWIEQLAVSPDGKRAVTVHNRSLRYVYDARVKPIVMLHDLAAGTAEQLFADDKKLSVEGIRWTADSKGFFFAGDVQQSSDLQRGPRRTALLLRRGNEKADAGRSRLGARPRGPGGERRAARFRADAKRFRCAAGRRRPQQGGAATRKTARAGSANG